MKNGHSMRKSRFSSLSAVVFVVLTTATSMDRAVGQEIGLTPFDAKEVARGYRADALKFKPVINDKNETIGRIDDFIFSKDGNNIYAVLAVGDFTGVGGQLVAVPFHNLKLDDPSGDIVLPGASRSALQKLPVYVTNKR